MTSRGTQDHDPVNFAKIFLSSTVNDTSEMPWCDWVSRHQVFPAIQLSYACLGKIEYVNITLSATVAPYSSRLLIHFYWDTLYFIITLRFGKFSGSVLETTVVMFPNKSLTEKEDKVCFWINKIFIINNDNFRDIYWNWSLISVFNKIVFIKNSLWSHCYSCHDGLC